MRSNFLKGSIVAVLTALLIGGPQLAVSQVILADSALAPANRIGVGQVLSAVSTDVGVYVRYVGTDTGTATVEVDAATGDLTFIENGAASTSFECPVSGALGGVIDVSNASCNTIGEVVDTINGKCTGCVKSKWVAAPHAMLRSESSNNTLITLSATNAKVPYGVGLLKDTAVALNMAVVLNERYDDEGTAIGIQNYLGPDQKRLPVNPFKNTATAFLYGSGLMTTTDNVANTLDVYCVVPKNSDSGNDSETVRTLYTEASGATTVVGTVSELNNGIGAVCRGGKLIFRIDGNTTLTVPTLVASGYTFPNRP